MEFAWNTQKNKLTDVKGKEIEQERKSDNLKNDDIDRNKTHLNYDLIQSNLNLYQRVKNRVDAVRQNSRIQKNSVVMYSNVITVNKNEFQKWGTEKTKAYFECVTEFFQNEFGKENVVSAKVHLDETTPHMHLHFVPISEEGKLQAHKIMTKSRINKIHTNAPKFLQEKGFNVERGIGETGGRNIKNIHKYKAVKLNETVIELTKQKDIIEKQIEDFRNILDIDVFEVDSINGKEALFNKKNVIIDKDNLNNFKNAYTTLLEAYNTISKSNFSLNLKNKNLMKEIDCLNEYKKSTLNSRNFYLSKRDELIELEQSLKLKEEKNRDTYSELFSKEIDLNKEKKKLEEDKKNYKDTALKEVEEDYERIINIINEGWNSYIVESENKNDINKKTIEKLEKENRDLIDENTQLKEFNSFLKKTLSLSPKINEKFIKDIDNSYVKFIYSDIPKVKKGDIYEYKDAKELIEVLNKISLLDKEKKYVKFEVYKDINCKNKIGSSSMTLGINKQIDLLPNLAINSSKEISYDKSYDLEL